MHAWCNCNLQLAIHVRHNARRSRLIDSHVNSCRGVSSEVYSALCSTVQSALMQVLLPVVKHLTVPLFLPVGSNPGLTEPAAACEVVSGLSGAPPGVFGAPSPAATPLQMQRWGSIRYQVLCLSNAVQQTCSVLRPSLGDNCSYRTWLSRYLLDQGSPF